METWREPESSVVLGLILNKPTLQFAPCPDLLILRHGSLSFLVACS